MGVPGFRPQSSDLPGCANASTSFDNRIRCTDPVFNVSNLSTNLNHILTTSQVQFHMTIPLDVFATDTFEARDVAGSKVVVHLIDLLTRTALT